MGGREANPKHSWTPARGQLPGIGTGPGSGERSECSSLERAAGKQGPLVLEKGGNCVSPLSDSGVIGGSTVPPELIRAIINKLNMKEIVVSGSWG